MKKSAVCASCGTNKDDATSPQSYLSRGAPTSEYNPLAPDYKPLVPLALSKKVEEAKEGEKEEKKLESGQELEKERAARRLEAEKMREETANLRKQLEQERREKKDLALELERERSQSKELYETMQTEKLNQTALLEELNGAKKDVFDTKRSQEDLLNTSLTHTYTSERLKQQLNLKERLTGDQLETWSAERKELSLHVADLEQQLKDSQRKVLIFGRKLQKGEVVARDNQVKILELSQSRGTEEESARRAQLEKVGLEKENVTLKKELRLLQLKCAQAEDGREKAHEMVEQLLEENATEKQTKIELESKNQALNDKFASETNNSEKWSKKIVALARENKELKEKIQELTSEYTRKQTSLTEARAKRVQAEQLYYKSQQRNHELQELLDNSMVRENKLAAQQQGV